jgi:hypothetical protein
MVPPKYKMMFIGLLTFCSIVKAQTWSDFPLKQKNLNYSITHNQTFILQFKKSTSYTQLNDLFQSLNVPFEIEIIDSNWNLLGLYTQNDTHFGTFGALVYPSRENVLQKLKESNLFNHFQSTHPIQKRKVPNDTYLNKQFQFSLTKNYNVWENSIGGTDRNGDTIVVAIIDDGLDTSHADLKDNLWHNWNEIPYNGIDDDGNGFIDDYLGWNGGDQTPFIFNSESIIDGHGTCVAGIFGARGNNNTGIAGTNWTTKIMPILCYPSDPLGDGELGVIRSMIYAYKMKKLYLESNKMKGANIVAINMSVGMDNAFASDAPIWCSMYDSLGKVGIVSVSAATNRNVDVSVTGDIPTLCGSQYLITVSSSDDMDQHAPSGYSKFFVDLAAPGENLYTASPNAMGFPYKEESGTSFAAPQVSGAVSLVHAAACKAYLSLLNQNPDSAIALVKLWMLSMVDTNNSLTSKTLSGGRLNTLGMWQAMDSWCWKHDSFYSQVNHFDDFKIKFFPNPNNGKFTVFSNIKGQASLAIYDIVGHLIYNTAVFEGNTEINIPLASGNYVVVFEGQKRQHRELLVVLD